MLEVFDVLQNELKKIPYSGLVPAGVVITGGGAKLSGLSRFVKEKLKLPVRIGARFPLDGLADNFGDPALAVAAGLALYGFGKEMTGKNQSKNIDSGHLLVPVKKFLSWLKNFSP